MNLFDEKWGDKLKQEGMARAADNVKEHLIAARRIAKAIAQRTGTANADQVGRVLKLSMGVDSLGPAAGSIFKGKEWEFTGNWVKSKRITNHSRMIREWRLTNEER